MKKKFKSFALILLMCGTIASAWADGADANYIINEDFSRLKTSWTQGEYEYGDFTLFNSHGATVKATNVTLKLEGASTYGYAVTKNMNYTGKVLLVYSHGKNSSETSAKMTLSLEGGGTFKEGGGSSKTYSITNNASTSLQDISFEIEGVQSNSRIWFIQEKVDKNLNSIYIDNVKIIKLGDLTLDETIDSREPIEANNGTECAVQTNRTLTGGIWNTLCLPFDVDMDLLGSVLGANQDIQLRTYTGYADKVMTFESATEVAAGTPFLIKLNTTVVNPAFTGDNKVTIVNTPAQSVTHNGVSFVGTYGPVDLQTDGSELFITKSSNMLSVPAAASNRMYGMRAFIRVTGSSGPARIVVGDDETADLSTAIMAEEQDKKVYDLNGQQVMHPKRGLYIVNNKITFLK